MALRHYFLGCPVWANKAWQGTLFTRRAKPAELLSQYAGAFNTVEGNQTFYGLPAADTVRKWLDAVPPDFRFCFKFPKAISHERRLVDCERELADFLHLMLHLHGRVGLLWLQLPPVFGPGDLEALDRFLGRLPCDFHYAVEVRHESFGSDSRADRSLNRMLAAHHANRCLFHTETLHSLELDDPAVREAKQRKPALPARPVATDQRPMVRYVGHPEVEPNRPALARLARQTATWLRQGLTPFIFIHTPDDLLAPQQCRLFHELLAGAMGPDGPDVGTLEPWAGETELVQGELF